MRKLLKDWFTIWGICVGAMAAIALAVWGIRVVFSAIAAAWGVGVAIVVGVVLILGFAAFMTALETRHGSNLPPLR